MYAHTLIYMLHTKSNIKCSSCEALDGAYTCGPRSTVKMLMDGRAEGSGHETFGKEQKFNDFHIRGTAVWQTLQCYGHAESMRSVGLWHLQPHGKITFYVTRIECKLLFGSGKMWNGKQTHAFDVDVVVLLSFRHKLECYTIFHL